MRDNAQSDLILTVLQKLDQKLAHSSLREQSVVPNQAIVRELRGRLRRLQDLRAPLYIEEGHGPRLWLKRLANIPIAALSSKQAIYNRELLELLALLLSELDQGHRSVAEVTLRVEQQETQIRLLREALLALSERDEAPIPEVHTDE